MKYLCQSVYQSTVSLNCLSTTLSADDDRRIIFSFGWWDGIGGTSHPIRTTNRPKRSIAQCECAFALIFSRHMVTNIKCNPRPNYLFFSFWQRRHFQSEGCCSSHAKHTELVLIIMIYGSESDMTMSAKIGRKLWPQQLHLRAIRDRCARHVRIVWRCTLQLCYDFWFACRRLRTVPGRGRRTGRRPKQTRNLSP